MFSKKTTLYAKLETTSGTDATPTAAANAVMAFDVSLDIKADMKERYPGNSDRSAYGEIRGKTVVDIKFKVELKGSGTAGTPPKYAPLLQACDRLMTTSPATNVIFSMALLSTTCTIWVNIDGILHKMVGCAGDCEIDLTSGEVPWLIFTMTGVYALATDTVIEAMTFDSTTPVIVKGTTTTFGSYAAIIEKINLKFGNKVVERTSLAATEGVLAFMVGDRYPTGTLTCEAVLRATSNADFLSYFDAGTTKALSFALGATAGNITTIAAPVCKLRAPKYGDRSGLRTIDLEFQMARSSGNDEMSITLT
jgi:hypothetical protein